MQHLPERKINFKPTKHHTEVKTKHKEQKKLISAPRFLQHNSKCPMGLRFFNATCKKNTVRWREMNQPDPITTPQKIENQFQLCYQITLPLG